MDKENIMSNSEFKEGQEVWVKVKIKDNHIDTDGEILVNTLNKWDCWVKPEDIMTVIPEKQELSEIPQYVADKIEYCKNLSGYNLFHAMDYCFQFEDSADWLECNEETFAKAWFYGYEVVQEKLYTVEIPNPNEEYGAIVLARTFDNNIKIDTIPIPTWKSSRAHQLTEEEIKKDFLWAWDAGFAKDV